MRRAYTYNLATITAPIWTFQDRPATTLRHAWTDAEKATYALAVARNNLRGAHGQYLSACEGLGRANRLKGAMRRRWVAQAFRSINLARRSRRKALAAFDAAMANPALASDQVAV